MFSEDRFAEGLMMFTGKSKIECRVWTQKLSNMDGEIRGQRE
jgi:hypothetical protein